MAQSTYRSFVFLAVTAAATLLALPDAHAQQPEPEIESPAMMYTGIALTVTGGVGLGVGNAVFFTIAGGRGDFAGLAAVIYGGAILLPSSVLAHIGIPLWAFGASERDRPKPSHAIPEVSIGAGGGSLRWTF